MGHCLLMKVATMNCYYVADDPLNLPDSVAA